MMKNDIGCSSILIYENNFEWYCVGGFCGNAFKTDSSSLSKHLKRIEAYAHTQGPNRK